MAKIQRPPDVLVPSGRTPGRFAGNQYIEADISRAAIGLGRSVQALAGSLLAWDEQIAQVQDADEEAKFLGLVNTENEVMRLYMEENPGLYSEFESQWAKSEEKFQKFTESVTRKRTQDRLLSFIEKNAPIWKSSVKQNVQNGIALQAKATTLNTIDSTIIGDKRNEAIAASGLAREDAIKLGIPEEEAEDIAITEKEYKTLMIERLISEANVNGMLWNPLEVRTILNNVEERIDSYQNTRHLAEESEIVYEAINRKDYEQARKSLKVADITEKQKAEIEIKITASERQNEQRLDDKERDLQTENQAKIASDIYADELDASVIDSNIEAALLPDAEGVRGLTVAMAENLKRLNKREDVTTNELVKGELEAMAYDIYTGAITMPEFNKRLREEWKKTIDNSAYDEIFSLAQREFKSYQAGEMKRREVHALGQLVTHPSELGFAEMLAQLTSKFEKEQAQTLRQLQFDNLDQYKKALRDWLGENKDANADEIYKKGRSLLTHYRKTPDQLRKGTEEIISMTQEQKEKLGRGIQEALIKGFTGQLKAKTIKSISEVPEPKERREFINKLRELQKINPDLSVEYYNKYLDKFW